MTMRKFDKAAISKLAAAVAEAEENFSAMVDEVQEYYDSRSEKWQESERGEDYQNASDALYNIYETIQSLNSDLQDLEDAIDAD